MLSLNNMGNIDASIAVCGLCDQLSSHLAGHMLSSHPGCGLLWGSGYCGNIIGITSCFILILFYYFQI